MSGVNAGSMGHLRVRRVTANDLFAGNDSNGNAKQLLIKSEGTGVKGSVLVRAGADKATDFNTSSSGADIRLEGEVVVGSANHAALLVSNAAVSTKFEMRASNASSEIRLTPGKTSNLVVNKGNYVSIGGAYTSRDTAMSLFTEGIGTHDIVIDPRTKTDGGDLRIKSNIFTTHDRLESSSTRELRVKAAKRLVMEAARGNVVLQPNTGNNVIFSKGANLVSNNASTKPFVIETLASDITLKPAKALGFEIGTDFLVSAQSTTLDASNNVSLEAENTIRFQADKDLFVRPTGDLDISTTAGNVVSASFDATITTSNSTVVTSAKDVRVTATGDALLAPSGNATITSVDTTVTASNSTRITSSKDLTLTATGDVKLVGPTGNLSASAIDATITASNSTVVTSSKDVRITAAGDALLSPSGNAVLSSVDTTVTASNSTRITSSKDLTLTATGDVKLVGPTGNLSASAIDATITASNSTVVTSSKDVRITAAGDALLSPSGNLVMSSVDATLTGSNTVRVNATKDMLLDATLDFSLSAVDMGFTSSGNVATATQDFSVSASNNVRLHATAQDVKVLAQRDIIHTATADFEVSAVDTVVAATNAVFVTAAEDIRQIAQGNVLIQGVTDTTIQAGNALTLRSDGDFKFSAGEVMRIQSTANAVILDAATNVVTVTETFLGANASGLHLRANNGQLQLETDQSTPGSGNIMLNPGSGNVQIMTTTLEFGTDGSAATPANVRSILANLDLITYDTRDINLRPGGETHSEKPIFFDSNSVNYHVEATAGPLRLRGGDTDNTVKIGGKLEVDGVIDYITSQAETLLLADKQIVLNNPSDNSGTNDDTASGSGIYVNGTDYDSTPEAISLLWNKGGSGASPNDYLTDPAPFWTIRGGDFSVMRGIDSGAWSSPFSGDAGLGGATEQLVEFRFHITPSEKLQVQKVLGRKAVDSNFASTRDDALVVAEFDLVA
jgi:hypothetical protein